MNDREDMDRREALKKRAAGGAIAMGGSFVPTSNAVAYAASGPSVVTVPPTSSLTGHAVGGRKATGTLYRQCMFDVVKAFYGTAGTRALIWTAAKL
jgi:hypothetical protein